MKWKTYTDASFKFHGDIQSVLRSEHEYAFGPNGEILELWSISTRYRPYMIYAHGCHVWTVLAYSGADAIRKYSALRNQVTTKLEARKV